eukprot:Seg4882.2 transcript_id=Seg4882.2/GoldUCD/mRNA.D3Y31 product="hypothetical protein" protein_id=Seg4882.2/GoldUCD/D3Y31
MVWSGEHTWSESSCLHGPLVSEDPKVPLQKKSSAAEALRVVVFDKRFTNNLPHHIHFRHTGGLDSFNSMQTKYAPKRLAFEFIYFVACISLAAPDHNMHLFRNQARNNNGELLYKRKYSRRSREYHAEPVQENKMYAYIPKLVATIIKKRQEKDDSVLGKVAQKSNDPKLIAPTIELNNPPPPTAELVQNRLSRMQKS